MSRINFRHFRLVVAASSLLVVMMFLVSAAPEAHTQWMQSAGVQSVLAHGTPEPRPTIAVAAPSAGNSANGAPTYYADVKPIIDRNCLGCHVPSGIGANVMLLDSPEKVLDHAKDIDLVVSTRYMPPWMPGKDTPPLLNERKLTDAEIATVMAWVKAGAPLGDPKSAAAVTPAPAAPKLRADLVVQSAQPYLPSGERFDDYRCFLIDPKLTEEVYMTGYAIQPEQPTIVHHVLLFQVGAEVRDEAVKKEQEDARPGWECFGGTGLNGADLTARLQSDFSASLGSWTPGSRDTFYPQGTGFKIPAGNLLVMQVHYNMAAPAKADQTRAILQLAAKDEKIEPLRSTRQFAPVELPCPAENTSAECRRETAFANSTEVQRARVRSQGMLSLCRKSVADYEKQPADNVVSTCDTQVREDGYAIEVNGHMHTRGKSIRLEVNPGKADAQVLLDIPRWSFHWQGSYQFKEPIALKRGDVIRVTCVWDNTRDKTPRYIVWGEGTDDEMCLSSVVTSATRKNLLNR